MRFLRQAGRGILWLLPVAFVVHLVYTVIATDRDALGSVIRLSPWLLALTLLTALVPWLSSALRIWTWARLIRPELPVSPWRCFKVQLACDIGAAMTPSATGGAPFKAGMLVRSGLTTAEAITITALASVEDVLFMSVALPITLVTTGLGNQAVQMMGRAVAAAPGPVGWWVVAALAVLGTTTLALARRAWARRLRVRIARGWREIVVLAGFLRRRGGATLLLNLAMTGVYWSARLSILTVLLSGLGFAVEPLRIALLQWLCFTAMSLVPTPGALGGAEAAFMVVLAGEVPPPAVPAVLAAWRFVTFYALTGLAVLLVSLPIWRGRTSAGERGPERDEEGGSECGPGDGLPGSVALQDQS